MKKILFTLLLAFMIKSISAQQLPYYSQYMLNSFLLNPAVAGTEEGIPLALTYRNQWAGFADSPKTIALSANGMMGERVGLGGIVFSERTGPLSKTGFQASYAYHLEISNTIKMAMGLSGLVHQHVLDQDKLTLDESNDMAVQGGKQSTTAADANLGLYLYHEFFFVGFSAPQLFQSNLALESNQGNLNRLYRHYFFNVGGNFIVNDKMTIQPSLLVKAMQASPYQFDLNCKFLLENKYWAGLSYRDQESIVFLAGLKHNEFSFGLAYDFGLNSIRRYSSGSHELYVAYNLHKVFKKKPIEEEKPLTLPEKPIE